MSGHFNFTAVSQYLSNVDLTRARGHIRYDNFFKLRRRIDRAMLATIAGIAAGIVLLCVSVNGVGQTLRLEFLMITTLSVVVDRVNLNCLSL